MFLATTDTWPAQGALSSEIAGQGRSGRPRSFLGCIRLKERQLVFSSGDRAEAVFVILSGAVALTRIHADGTRQVLEILGRGSLFGLVGGATYDSSAEALSATVVQRIERSTFERSDRLQRELAAHLLHKIETFHDHTARLGRRSARERVASFLLELPRVGNDSCSSEGQVAHDERIALAQSDIGAYLGLTLETVCRAMTQLKRDRIIDVPRRGRVAILDPIRLASIARGAAA